MNKRVIALCSLLAACGQRQQRAPVDTSWHQELGYRWRALDVAPDGKPGFTTMDAKETGVQFENFVSDSALLGNRILGQGAGVCLGDVDGDGRPDVFLARTEGGSRLYRNLGDWHFQDVTAQSGINTVGRYATGCALADVDGNNTLDLILLATKGPNVIYLNDGHGHFTEHRDLGLDTTGKGGTTATLSDVDGSGRLAMFVANYKPYNLADSLPPQRRAFNQMVRQTSPGKYDVVPEWKRDYQITNRPDMGGLRLSERGAGNDFYMNDGHGHFTRVPFTSSRFRDADGKPLTQEPQSFSLDAKFVDLSGHGAPDLYITNDFEDLDQLWRNDGHGNFRLANWTAQRQISNSAMGVDVGDVNGDGLPDIFVTDMLANDSHRLKTQIPTHTALPKRPGDVQTELQQQRNTLFLNRGDGTFAEVGMQAGVQASGWSWGTMLLDVDLDGYPDILIANGHLWDIMDADVQERLQNRLTGVSWQRTRWQFPKLELKNVAFRNRGDLTFEDVSQQWGFGVAPDISHTMAAADLDGDGDLDVVVNRLNAPALLLRNNSSAARVAVRLVGNAPNTQAVGSKIRLLGGATPVQVHEVQAGGLYMSHSDYQATFAMGKADSAKLVVEWRDGRRTEMEVRSNRLYEITTATGRVPALSREPKGASRQSQIADRSPITDHDSALFEDVTPMLGGHRHVETYFDDWERQFLLPNALSQLGPGVAWFDYDRDGNEDLIIGAGRGGSLGVFHNDHGRLTKAASGPVAQADYTGLVGMAANGATQLVVGQANWEGGYFQPSAITIAAGKQGLAAGGAAATPIAVPSTGPLAMADYDGDGSLDLFVGGRALPGKYPEAASSALYRNVNGRFVFDSANAQVLSGVGLVSAAMFADIDGDGHPDLILAREWGSILILLNRGGRFVPAPDSWGLSKWTSRWNGIAAGDLDGDGRLDLVATSWGRNTATPADSTRPLVMFYGPIGQGSAEEMLLARYDARVGGLAPLNSYPRVRDAIPDLAKRITTFSDYADATVEKVLGPAMKNVRQAEARTMDHMVFFNRGDHFEAVALPAEAQEAPAFYAGIADFDGDGAEDVFISQNFFPTAVGLPRYDEGRGLLLKGDGKGGLTPVSGARSGIVVYGDQRGAAYADYDGDGRLDLAVSQNGAETRLFHNRGAKPGLRVRLQGPAANPDAIGAQMRIVYGDHMGPVREIQAGSGYWSQNGATQVFGLSGTPTAVWVRWPGGRVTQTAVAPGAREVAIRLP